MQNKLLTYSFIFTLLCSAGLFAKEDSVDYEQMQRDLGIMKVVLDHIMSPEQARGPLMRGNTRAIYLGENGVVFVHQYPFAERLLFAQEPDGNFVLDRFLQAPTSGIPQLSQSSQISRIEKNERSKPQEFISINEKINKEQEKIEQNVTEFLGDYCNAIKQLGTDDKITVIILPAQSVFFPMGQWAAENQTKFPTVMASVKKADIQKFRREEIDFNNLHQRINFTASTDQGPMNKDIRIMSTFFNSALAERRTNQMVPQNDIWGIYVQDFGALFTVRAQSAFSMEMFFYSNDKDNNVITFSNDSRNMLRDNEERIEHMKTNIIGTLADYGKTLRHLDDDEWIGVVLETSELGRRLNDHSTIFLKVRKKDSDALNKRKISLAEFKKRIVVTEY